MKNKFAIIAALSILTLTTACAGKNKYTHVSSLGDLLVFYENNCKETTKVRYYLDYTTTSNGVILKTYNKSICKSIADLIVENGHVTKGGK